ncbi:septation ring formation regulator EzrA [Parageobacillus thermoglucosidasius]|uniref:Septation ring formation regulator EzrA n=1 Tax=Geobacillus sp. (strain Y4.1MC1) TaxID=581103 RepID=A0A7U3YDK1_GEOS0|nr:septation ring formation regulator EzrA [Parageobacillus thermoglucosidasius]MED4903722.1 septation ring formation regulator EzrA [Parageobacillus thermoglucosidasius]MED4912608.1 septation ring formation regulator EzrA [Parageobacillus thermoglucosidasius]MED4944400.1 septation ring formation regulator EzrA [Parageobacillus thermoglucosidasius]MED4981998.1 septation ring formation regulator EzrA [Parageobacillus thermoglucosidasius]RDE20345.1 septation ring formation regulator EzrA [Parage
MEIAIIVLLLLGGVMIYNHMYRKKMYGEIDRLEAWKVSIMNRPVPDELSKVKQLNMTGETEQLFEKWRQKWDDLVAVQLPNIEEKLFDTEELLDKYRYAKARAVLREIDQLLRQAEGEVQLIIDEVHELIGSEEQNRTEIEELRTTYRDAKKTLLAYRYTFGVAAAKLDEKLEEMESKFQDFEKLTESGNYLAAREVVLSLKKELNDVTVMMNDIPELLTECQTTIPAQLEELLDGYREMKQEGYILDHLQIEREIAEKRKRMEQCLQMIRDLRIDEAKQGVIEIKEEIDTLYDLLEKEVTSHHYIKTEMSRIAEMLNALNEEAKETSEETLFVQQSYQLSTKDLEKYRSIEKQIHQLMKRFEIIHARVLEAKTAYSLLKEELEQLLAQIEMMKEEHEQFRETLQMLRKDELVAREKLDVMKKKLSEALRLVQKSRLPGLPKSYELQLSEAKDSLMKVALRLEEKPLNMPAVSQALEEAETAVQRVYERTVAMIEQASLVEKVIQYGNRYRRRYPSVKEGLEEAEYLFRHYDYEQALEQAVAALEKVEPGALQRIQQIFHEERSKKE